MAVKRAFFHLEPSKCVFFQQAEDSSETDQVTFLKIFTIFSISLNQVNLKKLKMVWNNQLNKFSSKGLNKYCHIFFQQQFRIHNSQFLHFFNFRTLNSTTQNHAWNQLQRISSKPSLLILVFRQNSNACYGLLAIQLIHILQF